MYANLFIATNTCAATVSHVRASFSLSTLSLSSCHIFLLIHLRTTTVMSLLASLYTALFLYSLCSHALQPLPDVLAAEILRFSAVISLVEEQLALFTEVCARGRERT